MAKQVGVTRSGLEAGLRRQAAQDQEGAGARQPASACVQEELGSMPLVEEGAAPADVAA